MKADAVFLQETHSSTAVPKFSNRDFPTGYHALTPNSKTKGVTIFISKNTSIKITDTLIDEQGRYIFLKGNIQNRPITLETIYCPNVSQDPFVRKTLQSLASFQSGTLILGGDLNVPLCPLLDTSTGTSSLPYRALHQLKLSIQSLLLHDTWRTLRPQEKDFTFFSIPHKKYSRLDYLFLTQNIFLSCLRQQ